MKKILFLLVFILPFVAGAQQSRVNSAPLNYAWKYVGIAEFAWDEVWETSLAFSPSGEPYVAFSEGTYQGSRIVVMKYDGLYWNFVGLPGFSDPGIMGTSIAFSPSGEPYVAFSTRMVTIMKYDGNDWVKVGTDTLPKGDIYQSSLQFDPQDGAPWIMFVNRSGALYNNSAEVMKFDGDHWVNMGYTGSLVSGYSTSFALSPSGQPYIAFEDGKIDGKITVMTCDGNTWSTVGPAGISIDWAWDPDVAIGLDGKPYVSFEDYWRGNRAVVMKFEESKWVFVGDSGISATEANHPNLAFNPAGQPYVAFEDQSDSGKATVMNFDGSQWNYVGRPCFSPGAAYKINLVFSPSGQPFIAYPALFTGKAAVLKYDSVGLGINEEKSSLFSLYPNPATNLIYVKCSTISSVRIEIYSPTGTLLVTKNFLGQQLISLDISGLSAGMYFIKVITGDLSETSMFVKD